MAEIRLSKSMRGQWDEQGYLVLKQAIPRDEVASYLAEADRVIETYTRADPERYSSGAYTIVRTLERTSGLDGLMDHPGTFGVILDLMGPYLQIMGSQIYVRHPSDDSLMGWHTDAGPSLAGIRVERGSPPLNFKVQIFLTDIPEQNCANFCVVPGSHRQEFPSDGLPNGAHPPDMMQLCVDAGDVAISPHNLWHGVAPNKLSVVRRSVTLRYGQMWCRPYDYEKAPPVMLARMTPRRRRLMGDLGDGYTPTDYFKPKDQIEVIMEGFARHP